MAPQLQRNYNFGTIADYFEDIPASIGITLGNPNLDFREHDNFFYVGDDLQGHEESDFEFGPFLCLFWPTCQPV